MAYFRCSSGSGGGIVINPQVVYQTKTLAANTSYSYTPTQGKTYLGIMSLNVNGSGQNAQQNAWFIKDGVITDGPSYVGNFKCAMDGSNIKFTNSTGGYASFTLTQLD